MIVLPSEKKCNSIIFDFTDCPNIGETVQDGACACANTGEIVQNGACACPAPQVPQNGQCKG